MTRDEFEALVRRLEKEADAQPTRYRVRVALLAGLGYAYILLILLLVLALLGAVVPLAAYSHAHYLFSKVAWALLFFAFFILRSFWVRFRPPDGLELTRKEVPHLYQMIDELTSALQAPRFHRVLLTDEFNATVVQIPRLGLLGWQRNYLLLGLPLMQALSPAQFSAVVAHELGHLSGNHGRFFGWVYRVRRTWDQLLHRLEEGEHLGAILFVPFFFRYAPFFGAYSFVLARADEYVADRCAAEAAGVRDAAEALIQLEIIGHFLEDSFWPSIFRQADQQAEPTAAPFAAMLRALRSGIHPDDATRWLGRALAAQTDIDDTHPSLADRLRALGYATLPESGPNAVPSQPPLPALVEESAAQRFFGEAVERLALRLDQQWRERVAPGWRKRYAHVQELQRRSSAIEEKAQHQALSDEEAWDRIRCTAELKGSEAAIPLLRAMLAAQPEEPAAHYTLGQILLEQKDPAGIHHIEQAMERESDTILSGCSLVYHFLKTQGREEEARCYRQRADQHYTMLVRARLERSQVRARDTFRPHALPPEEVENLRRQLSAYEHLREAYLVRKVVTHLPEKPCYVLGVVRRLQWRPVASGKYDARQVERELTAGLGAQVKFPGETQVVLLNTDNPRVGKALRQVEGSKIYP